MWHQAVVAHVYYHDMWDDFALTLRGAGVEFDRFVTLTIRPTPDGIADTAALRARIDADFPRATVLELPNHGRDIYPFVHLINSGWLDGYDAVCKIHTKMSPQRSDGEDWRQSLISGILPNGRTAGLLAAFKADEKAAFWVSDGHNLTDPLWWGTNFEKASQILNRAEIAPKRDHLSFPAGSIYWLKPLMIRMIRRLQLSEQQFEPEQGQTDGTFAHGFERSLGYLAAAGGLEPSAQYGQTWLEVLAAHLAPKPGGDLANGRKKPAAAGAGLGAEPCRNARDGPLDQRPMAT